MAHALLADEKDERFPARSPGVKAGQAACIFRLQRLDVGPDVRLGKQRQAREVRQRTLFRRVKSDVPEQRAVIGDARMRVRQEFPQASQLQRCQTLRVPPLRPLQFLAHRNAAMAFDQLMQRKRQPRDDAGIERRHHPALVETRPRPALVTASNLAVRSRQTARTAGSISGTGRRLIEVENKSRAIRGR